MRRRGNRAKPGSAFALMILLAGCGPETCGNIGGLTQQARYGAFQASELFDDGRAMRPPIPGTVSLDAPKGSIEVLTGKDEKGKPLAQIPVPLDRPLLERGRQAFTIYCAVCHGILGDGNSTVAKKMSLRAPPSLQALYDRPLPPGQIFGVMTSGYGLMPSYAAEIPVRERWGVVAYLQALIYSEHAPLSRAPPAIRRQLEGGKP